MSIESLKQQARRHEQDEQWQKALDQYKQAIKALAEDDQTDIGLINRVGDLFVRVGKLDMAVEHYEQAVDLYREAFLPNNAIAVCKKIIRNVPDHHQAYLKIGQIRAEQGFLPDARTNFLTYAERMQQEGDLDESFRALVEFCDLAPDDVEVRITVAEQMVANERTEDAVDQLLVAYRHLVQSGEADLAAGVEKKVLELDPDADVAAAASAPEITHGASMGGDDMDMGLAGFEVEPHEEDEGPHASLQEAAEDIVASFAGDEDEESDDLPGLEPEDEEDEDVGLPTMDFDDEDSSDDESDFGEIEIETGSSWGDEEDDEESVELPTMGFDDDEEAEEEEIELPTMDFDDDEEEPVAIPTMDFDDDEDDGDEHEDVAEAFEEAVEDAVGDLPAVELEVEEAAEEEAPEAEEAPEVAAEPATEVEKQGDDYVDLGAMILGGGGGGEKSTRFKVAYEEPSGDEEADFAKMLTQFKEKVSENLDTGDVRAHHDLGTAYKEMGLLQEAIGSFQQALRASSEHLPTYELMGQTFIEMGQPEAAVNTLQRALQIKSTVEDEFVGIYYYLARAYEELDRKDSAVEYYDRVFALDINFADVTERLRALR